MRDGEGADTECETMRARIRNIRWRGRGCGRWGGARLFRSETAAVFASGIAGGPQRASARHKLREKGIDVY